MKILKRLMTCGSALLLIGCSSPVPGGSGNTSSDGEGRENLVTEFTEPDESNNLRSYYEIFVGSYADSNNDGMGDLKGVESKIPYIKSLGFRGIWLMPVFKSPSYHKYNTSDYYSVDPAYGTNEDLKSLVKVCHENNIKVILDVALNHSSKQNDYFKKAVAAYAKSKGEATSSESEILSGMTDAEITEYASLYTFFEDETAARSAGITYYQVPDHSFYYEGNFDSDMPEFNFDSSFAQEVFKKILHYWLDDTNAGVDGYRLDAVLYYYMGKAGMNYDALNKIYNYVLEKKQNAYVVGECWDSQATIASYYANTTLDSYFYFPGQGATGFLNGSLAGTLYSSSKFYNGEVAMEANSAGRTSAPFLDNHDTTRVARSKEKDAKFLYGLFSTLSGNTFTYYGDEIGLLQNGSNDESKRTKMPWGEGNDCNDPSNATAATAQFGTVKEQEEREDSLVNFVKKANMYRLCFPLIAKGRIQEDECHVEEEGYLLKIVKKDGDSRLTILYNFSQTDTLTFQVDSELKLVGALETSGGSITMKGNTVSLPARSIAYLK